MSIELFIFDWSGTISDDRKPVYEANMRILKAYGKQVIPFKEWLSISTSSAVEFLSSQGINWNPSILSELYKRYYNEEVKNGNAPKIYPKVKNVLKHLKDKRKELAVLSSHPECFLLKEAKDYEISNLFFLIMGGIKDKKIGLETVYKNLDYLPESTIYIGDTIYDIRAAKSLNLKSAAVCGGYHSKDKLKEENPDYLLENLSTLKDIIQ